MRKLAAPSAAITLLGLGQSVSGWQSPLIGFALMVIGGLLGAAALAEWMRPRWTVVDRCYAYLGIAPLSSDMSVLVPDEHRTELRAVVKNALDDLDRPAPELSPVDNPRLKAAAAAHFPELLALTRAYTAAERELHAAHEALTRRITSECESRGITESTPVLQVHAALYSRLLLVAEHRMPPERYGADWTDKGGMSDLHFADAVAWAEVSAIRTAYDAERAARLAARDQANNDAARELIYATPHCPTCALNLGREQSS
jgi:hypothetical protein